MSKYTGPKYRLCRREGINLFGNEKYNLTKKAYAPGIHGPKGSFAKPSEYSRQLREKQKLKRYYGVSEKQLSNYFKQATKKKDITGEALLKLLKTRFDNVVFEAGFAKSRPQARQMINHGHFKLNGKKTNIPSCQLKSGDTFEVVEKLKQKALYSELNKQKFTPPKWLKVDYSAKNGEVTRVIEKEDLEKFIQTSLIVEYYSK